ncbi:MAG: C69 family dipeptidase, partial [Tidjanibacter sp.]|nr:C69 family dipeptidase [Tidjanibacter sp.]
MNKKLFASFLALVLAWSSALACTNLIVTRGASTDGSNMVSYAADSHQLYGALYHTPAGKWKAGSLMDVYEWDTSRYLGKIPQVAQTYSTIGNMNEYQLIIGETTYGGRPELEDPKGGIDYGSLIYITLQRAKTAREAIECIVDLANTHGYASSGESFTIADKEEVWIMELIGKGPEHKGIVWVARRIPDGYISAHANHARITTFPKNDPENCLYAEDVISFARQMGFYDGSDEEFSFSDTYAPLDFSAMRGCEARVWSFFRRFADGMEAYEDYALGHNPSNRMPLWVKPNRKLSPKDVFDMMRDHYEGTVMDMTTDIGAGGSKVPYRWRPMGFEVDGQEYVQERAIATQQTGFWFVAQARPQLPDPVGGVIWFGTDDAATSPLTPIYCGSTEVPVCLSEQTGNILTYDDRAMFWITNRIAQFAYLRYDYIGAEVRKVIDQWENEKLAELAQTDAQIVKLGSEAKMKKAATK